MVSCTEFTTLVSTLMFDHSGYNCNLFYPNLMGQLEWIMSPYLTLLILINSGISQGFSLGFPLLLEALSFESKWRTMKVLIIAT